MTLPFQVSALAKLKVLKESVTHIAGGRWPLHLVVVAVLGLLAYSNTFNVPFQWDEGFFITDNPIIKDLNYFLEPSKAKWHEQYSALKGRYIGYLSFALNYKIHGTDVTGYHVVNLAVHIFNALLVYLLVILTFRTPFLKESSLKEHAGYIALFTALLFVSHPIQTEAVTYIFQRLASLMAFFYLLSLVAYIGSRLSTGKSARYTLYTVSLVSAVLAMKTKENAFTLPIVITLYEFFFFRGLIGFRTLRLIPVLLTLFIIPLTLTGIDKPIGEIIKGVVPDTSAGISRWEYLLTQFRVIVTYIRLLFLPVNQNFAYDYPVLHSFFAPQVLLSFLFLSAIVGYSIYLYFHLRYKAPWLRLICFGIFWFFITLSIESGVIPIPMVINEYRVYLPSVGAFLAAATVTFLLLKKLKNKKVQTTVVLSIIAVILIFSYATYSRNSVWRSKTSLWEDVASKSNQKAKAHNNLALAYMSAGLTDRAIEHFQIALRLKPTFAEAYYNIGIVYESKGMVDKAIENFKISLKLKPNYASAHLNLGRAYWSKGFTDKAIEHFQIALRIDPYSAKAHYNLGLIYLEKGFIDKARREFEAALKINPDYNKARQFLKYLSNQFINHPWNAVDAV